MAGHFSVSQVNQYIFQMFRQDFLLRSIQVKAEVSNCKYHTSGHIYFTLKDQGGSLQAVMFAGNRAQGLKFMLKDGMSVIVSGRIEVYSRDGKYELIAERIKEEGIGELYARYLSLKNELEEMGLFSEIYKKPIPALVQSIGIVTAETGAAIEDILSVSRRRNPYVRLVLYPALVQGEYAADSIVKGIQTLDAMGLDVLIVGRGGGSIEDLWAFNERKVAEAIFAADTPIISAVGHETDFTIADFVSDLRAPTPSAAAELANFEFISLERSLKEKQAALHRLFLRKLEGIQFTLEQKKNHLERLSPKERIKNYRLRQEEIRREMQRVIQRKLEMLRHRLLLRVKQLEGLSPLKKLQSGFSFVTDEKGRRVNRVAQIKADEVLILYMTDGRIAARAEEIYISEES